MRKIITIISLMLVTCLMVFSLASCGSDEVTIGENGNWFIGEEDTGVKASGTNATIGSNGNWYLDGADTGKKAVGTDAERVTVGENGNWFIGATDTGVKAVCGKYVVDVETSTAIDSISGKNVAVTVVKYSDGTTETIRNELQDGIDSITLSSDTFIKGYAPALKLAVSTENYDHYEVPVTDDMFLMGKPDFNTVGTYPSIIVYGGRMTNHLITVVDSTDVTVTGVSFHISGVRVGTDISELAFNADFSNGMSYYVSLADAKIDKTPDLNKVGNNRFTVTYAGCTGNANLTVYDPTVNNINDISLINPSITIPHNADAQTVENLIKDNIVGNHAYAFLYEKMYGTSMLSFYITRDMLDTSAINTAMLGSQPIKLTVNIPGVGTATRTITAEVEANLSGANILSVYNNSTDVGFMLGTITAYDNGIATITGGQMGTIQSTYTVDSNNPSKITAVTSGMTLYFIVDNSAGTYEVYVPTGEPTAVYTNEENELKICVYADCVTVGTYQPAQGTNPESHTPIFSMPKSAINSNNQINVMNMLLTLNSDGSITME